MDIKRKQKLTYITIAFFFIFGGVEYAVVFPTIWAYLQQLGCRDENLLGVSVAAFSLSSMVAGPFVGKWFDKTHNAKLILIVMNVFEIVGSIMYFMAPSPWFVVLSRFVSGLGGCAGTAVMADISHSTTVEDRTSIVSGFQACRQIGLLTGPVFNLLLREFHFTIASLPVNKLTAPGIFMALVGIILEILFVLMYFNLGKLSDQQKVHESLQHNYAAENEDRNEIADSCSVVEVAHSQSSVNSDPTIDYVPSDVLDGTHDECEDNVPFACRDSTESNTCPHVYSEENLHRVMELSRSQGSDRMIEDAEKFMCSTCERPECKQYFSPNSRNIPADTISTITGTDLHNSSMHSNVDCENCYRVQLSTCDGFKEYSNEFLRDEIVVLLGLSFISFFAQTVLETIVTPLAQKFYNFGDFENSLLFLFAGIEILLAFLLINLLSRKVADRTLILAGAMLMIFSLAWYLIFVPKFPYGDWNSLPYFIFGIFTNLLGISLLIACCISLFSKLISKNNQGVAHGLRRTILSAGMILGPVWGGSTVNMLIVLFSVPLSLVSVFTILFCVSFSRLKGEHQQGDVSTDVRPKIDNIEVTLDDDHSSLLSNNRE